MSYCNKCGAYIPDNMDKCLACGKTVRADYGYSQAERKKEEPRENGNKSYDYGKNENKQYYADWAESEKNRRSSETRYYDYDVNIGNSQTGNRLFAAMSYLGILFLVPMFLSENDSFAKFHAKQGLGLFVFGIICDIISAIFPLFALLNLLRIYLIIKGISNAVKGSWKQLPYIGQYIK